jgi:putative transposase
MTNHIHLIATPRVDKALSNVMHLLGTRYVSYFNRRYARTGRLYEKPFKSMVIDTETYWYNCMRYVELNAVRAGLVACPSDYRWSSYRANACGIEDKLVVPHPLYLSLGETAACRQQSWREICGEALPEQELFEVRDAIRRGRILVA